MQLIQTQYYKLEYVEVDVEGNEVADGTRQTAVSFQNRFSEEDTDQLQSDGIYALSLDWT